MLEATIPVSVLINIRSRYNPSLQYHNFDHGLQTLFYADRLARDEGTTIGSNLAIACLCHDAGYIPGDPTNEQWLIDNLEYVLFGIEDSEACLEMYKQLNWDSDLIRSLISVTIDHQPSKDSEQEQLLSDADMMGFSLECFDFGQLNRKIEDEYITNFIDKDKFKAGRIKFLEQMLDRAQNDRLYFYGKVAPLRNRIAANNISKLLILIKGDQLPGDYILNQA